MQQMHQVAVLFEHPEWQKPLLETLQKRGTDAIAVDLKKMAYDSSTERTARVVFNQASPSAYVRGHERSVPQALAYLRHCERLGCDVINGQDAFLMELSKAAQLSMLRDLQIDHPQSIVFNDVEAAIAANDTWPRLLKPDLGGSGARIQVVENESELRAAFAEESVWQPDNLFLLQEYLPHDPDQGIIRLEILDGKLLYAMRVVTHGRFNLCPSPVCNPSEGGGACEIPTEAAQAPVEFYPYAEVPADAVDKAIAIMNASGIDVGGVEYLETPDGRRVFYDVNANSNLRPSIGEHFGFDPFERVVDFLQMRVSQAASA